MNQKRLIPPVPESVDPWERAHGAGYEEVWSLTIDPAARSAITDAIPADARRVLVPGCGSEIHLQRNLLSARTDLDEVWCTDWSQAALDPATESFSAEKVRYAKEDTTALSFPADQFDAVVVVNSILSSDDARNRTMLAECRRVLRPGGRLIGFFPTVLCALDITYLHPAYARLRESGAISLEESAFLEPTQNLRQVFYTPLRLARIVKEAGLERERFEIVMFDGDAIQKESERLYGIPQGEDLFVWEILAILRKP